MASSKRKHILGTCQKTGKVRYNSQSKALREVVRYDDLKRAYYYDYCDGWHTTSIGRSLALKANIVDEDHFKREYAGKRKISVRLQELLSREEKQNEHD